MSRLAFFDTNLFVYADDPSEPRKQAKAIELITSHHRQGKLLISLQVMQEYFAAATRKLGLPPERAQRKVELMSRMRVVRLEPASVIAAIERHRLHSISFWDSLILEAAQLGGAATVFSGDLQAGSSWKSLVVINPFE